MGGGGNRASAGGALSGIQLWNSECFHGNRGARHLPPPPPASGCISQMCSTLTFLFLSSHCPLGFRPLTLLELVRLLTHTVLKPIVGLRASLSSTSQQHLVQTDHCLFLGTISPPGFQVITDSYPLVVLPHPPWLVTSLCSPSQCQGSAPHHTLCLCSLSRSRHPVP